MPTKLMVQAAKPTPAPKPASAEYDLDSRWLLDIPQACRALHQSRAALFRLLAAGELGPSIKIGRRRLIPVSTVEAYIARLIAEEGDGAA